MVEVFYIAPWESKRLKYPSPDPLLMEAIISLSFHFELKE